MKRIIDLTHIIEEDIIMFPGDSKPEIKPVNSIDRDGFNQSSINFYSHTGTHMDAPCHMIDGGVTLDRLDIENFIGRAVVFDFSKSKKSIIDVSDLKLIENEIKSADFLLIYTGWSRFWNTNEYLKGYPVLSEEAVRWLVRFDLKGIGFDTISPDSVDSEDYYSHKTLLQYGILIIENLNNLESLSGRSFEFSAVPLRFKGADGAPVNAYAVVDSE